MVDSLLREVDEDLRADKMVQLWREWRQPLLYAAIALIVGTAGKSVWYHYKEQHAQAAMSTLTQARDLYTHGDFAGAAQGFHQLAADSGDDLHDIAMLWEGRALLAADQKDKAVQTFSALALNPQGDDLAWRDLACLRLAGLSDTIPAPCDSASASPLKTERDEWRAARLAQQGKTDEARAILTSITESASASSSQRARAADLLSTLGEPVKKTQ